MTYNTFNIQLLYYDSKIPTIICADKMRVSALLCKEKIIKLKKLRNLSPWQTKWNITNNLRFNKRLKRLSTEKITLIRCTYFSFSILTVLWFLYHQLFFGDMLSLLSWAKISICFLWGACPVPLWWNRTVIQISIFTITTAETIVKMKGIRNSTCQKRVQNQGGGDETAKQLLTLNE